MFFVARPNPGLPIPMGDLVGLPLVLISDRTIELLVDVARGDRQLRRNLVLEAHDEFLKAHLTDIRVDAVVVRVVEENSPT